MRLLLQAVLAVSVTVALTAQTPISCPSEQGRVVYREWVKKVGLDHGKTYSASPSRQKQLKDGYTKLNLGMTREEVEKILGAPDAAGPARSQAYTESRHWCGYQWNYYLNKTDANEYASDDVGLFLAFDALGKLYWASPFNIKNLKQKGSPL